MRCKDARTQISLRSDGEVSDRNLMNLERHLKTCSECRDYQEDIARMRAIVASVRETRPPERLVGAILSRLGEPATVGQWVETSQFCRRLVPLAAAAMFLFALLAALWSPARRVTGLSPQVHNRAMPEGRAASSAESDLANSMPMEVPLDELAVRELSEPLED